MMPIEVAAGTHVGRVRPINQDAVHAATFHADRRACLIVADGLGGHAAGEVASDLAVRTMAAASAELLSQDAFDLRTAADSLRASVEDANARIHTQAQADPALTGMGTVIVAAWLTSDAVLLAHAGDSRAYLLSAGKFRQITADHSWVSEALREGRLSKEEARTDPRSNIVTRSLGTGEQVQVDLTGPLTLAAGDRLLLCTDGLHGVVTDPDSATILARGTLEQAVAALIEAANAGGGPDNIGVSLGGLH
jgi:serine/threonine protein phosphatase PrpC